MASMLMGCSHWNWSKAQYGSLNSKKQCYSYYLWKPKVTDISNWSNSAVITCNTILVYFSCLVQRIQSAVNFYYSHTHTHTHTHTHPFNGPLSETTRVSRYQKGKTNLDFTGARDSEWQWHQLGICKSAPRSRQITTPAPHHSVFYRPDALPAAQPTASKHWSTEFWLFSNIKMFRLLSFWCSVL